MVAWTTGADVGRKGLQRAILVALLLLALGLSIGVSQVLAVPPGQSAEDGQALFQGRCTVCHTVGRGDLLGPDLKDVTTRRDAGWLARFLADPGQMLAEGDPIATELVNTYGMAMPDLGLSEMEVAALIAYLKTQAESVPELRPSPAPTMTAPGGDAVMGKELFTGMSRFQNGGPSCTACHDIAGTGTLGGGALGPDLTRAYASKGDAVVAWPGLYSPMKEVYLDRSLTQEEKDNLLAFFKTAGVAQGGPQATGRLALLGVAGVLLLLGFAHLVWRRRLGGVRRPLVARRTSPYREILGG